MLSILNSVVFNELNISVTSLSSSLLTSSIQRAIFTSLHFLANPFITSICWGVNVVNSSIHISALSYKLQLFNLFAKYVSSSSVSTKFSEILISNFSNILAKSVNFDFNSSSSILVNPSLNTLGVTLYFLNSVIVSDIISVNPCSFEILLKYWRFSSLSCNILWISMLFPTSLILSWTLPPHSSKTFWAIVLKLKTCALNKPSSPTSFNNIVSLWNVYCSGTK